MKKTIKIILWALGIFSIIFVMDHYLSIFRIEDDALAQPWQEFKSEEYNFIVQIPMQKITEKELDSPLAKGKIFETESYRCIYRIEAMKLLPNLSDSDKDLLLKEIARASLKEMKENSSVADFSSTYTSNIYFKDKTKVVNYGWSGDPFKGRAFMDTSLAYSLQYICQDYDAHNKSIREHFLGSFNILKTL
jgi:hypothetical protein